MKIKISIADDHPLIISGLQNMLRHFPEFDIIATYENGAQLLQGFAQMLPDVLLLDIQMPGQSGTELAGIIAEQYPSVRILALTNLDNNFYIKNMLRQGVLGYLLKNSKQEILVEAIKAVNTGEQYLEPSLKERVWHDMMKTQNQNVLQPSLTRREKEILQLIASEYTSQEIAEKLFLSLRTIETHRLNLLSKLGLKNTAGLVKVALQMGLVQ